MHSSFLQQDYAAQVAQEDRSTDVPTQASSIRALIDPRFDTLISRATVSTRLNQISPESNNDQSLPSTNSNAYLDPKSQKVDKRQCFSPTCKNRLQGLLVGLVIAAISVAIVLTILLTRSSSSTVSSCSTLQWNPTGVTVIGNGSSGSSLNQLYSPTGVYVDTNDIVYVADSNNHRVLNVSSVTNGTGTGTVIAGITGVSGTGPTTLNTPNGIYVDSQQNLYIADTNNFRVQFWRSGATNGSTVAGSSTGIPGSTLDKLGHNYGLYVDQGNNVYVSDGNFGRVVKWSPGASTGVLVAGNGSSGYSSNQLALPLGITIDANSGILYITDFNAETLVGWVSGATFGTILAGSNSTMGNTPTLLNRPWGMIRDTYGNLYVGDAGNNRVQMFCANGSSFTSGKTIAGVGISQFSSTGLSLPAGIAFDSQMNLYVADSGNHRIQKFSRIS